MAGGAPYRVAIQDSAIRTNESVRTYHDTHGDVVEFPSKDDAEEAATRFSNEGDRPVRIQRVAPQDSREVDAYLIAAPNRRIRNPDGSLEDGYTFDVGAQQYGAIGEALILSYRSNPPALLPFIREDIDAFEATTDLSVAVDSNPDPISIDSSDGGTRKTWLPDCSVTAYDGAQQRAISTYVCEIKTGRASFERGQRAVMQETATTQNVLAIRIDISGLPETYTVKISKVAPPEEETANRVQYRNARLDDFST